MMMMMICKTKKGNLWHLGWEGKASLPPKSAYDYPLPIIHETLFLLMPNNILFKFYNILNYLPYNLYYTILQILRLLSYCFWCLFVFVFFVRNFSTFHTFLHVLHRIIQQFSFRGCKCVNKLSVSVSVILLRLTHSQSITVTACMVSETTVHMHS